MVIGWTCLLLGGLAGTAARWSAVLPALVALALVGTALIVIDFEVHRLPDRLVFAAALAGAALLAVAAAHYGAWHPYLRAIEGAAAEHPTVQKPAIVRQPLIEGTAEPNKGTEKLPPFDAKKTMVLS